MRNTLVHWVRHVISSVGLTIVTTLVACGGAGGGGGTASVGDELPQITSQPQPAAVDDGSSAAFSVSASGTGLSYQWQRDGTDLPGATAPELLLAAVSLADNGAQFGVTVRNSAGAVSSTGAALTVRAVAPSLLAGPQAASVGVNATATFSVTARGSAPLSYQWIRDGADIAGATASAYVTAPTVLGDNNTNFSVKVSNTAGSVVSASAALTVSAADSVPAFITQPADQSVNQSEAAIFTVAVSGSPTPSLQWQISVDGGIGFVDIVGATSSTFTKPATSLSDSGNLYRVVASNSAGTSTSAVARLTVQLMPAGQAFVYTSNSGSMAITGYSIDRSTGVPSVMAGSPYAGPTSAAPFLVLHPNGRFLYAVEANQPRTWVYAIDPSDGQLTLTLGSPFATLSVALEAPISDPSGRFLVFNQGFQLASYAIDPATGGLSPAGSVLFSKGSASLEFSQDSKFMFAQDGSSQLRVLRTNPLTLLTAAGATVPISSGTRFYSRSGYVLAQSQGAGLTSFTVNTAGELTAVQSLAGYGPNIAAHPNGRCFYMSGSVNGNAPSQSVTFTPIVLNPASGTLTTHAQVRVPVPGSVNLSQYPLLVNPTGEFGYLSQLDGFLKGSITPVSLDGDACTIAPRSPFDPGTLQQNVTFDSSGSLMLNHLTAVPSLYISRIDPVTRVPTQVAGSPVATNGATRQVVVR